MNICVNDSSLFVAESGNPDGIPLVLIHGFPFNHEMWSPQTAVLNDDYRIITYDLRGMGRSPAGDGQYTLEIFVDDLLALMDALKIEKAVVCGLSMGGYIALRALERNPERIRAVILADTRPEADLNEAKIKRAAALKTVRSKGTKVYAEGFVKGVFAPDSFARVPDAVARIRATIEGTSPVGICGALLALASRTDTTGVLEKIAVPALVLVGEHDTLTPPAVAKSMAAKIPGAELHVIPGAGHMSNLENSAEFNARLKSFLTNKVK